MRYTTSEPADRFDLLHLPQLLFQLAAARNVLDRPLEIESLAARVAYDTGILRNPDDLSILAIGFVFKILHDTTLFNGFSEFGVHLGFHVFLGPYLFAGADQLLR